MRDSVVRTRSVAEIAGLTAENIRASLYRIDERNEEWNASKAKVLWDSLTDEDKQDIIEVDGHRYIRKIYEARKEAKERYGENPYQE